MVVDERGRAAAPVSRLTVASYALMGVGLVAWFLYGWLVQRQGLVNSIGETAGTGFAVLLMISIIGSVRRARG
ncbi:hypothetical protein SAMN05421812_110168 [Asanoa hainanensis]|uniref:Uncharacterized protein n=1 Tax=Asanoa hainanensis TaxID=560556 RepID=A0A239NT71_9ACTN|nr:hypothetical protein [Asanoa hainanensis]SNT57618.1 hypothetical protein SAMN05421812_110168 [Asanoa hainanensis]